MEVSSTSRMLDSTVSHAQTSLATSSAGVENIMKLRIQTKKNAQYASAITALIKFVKLRKIFKKLWIPKISMSFIKFSREFFQPTLISMYKTNTRPRFFTLNWKKSSISATL